MIVKKLNEQNLNQFLEFCRIHRYVHDESFLYEEDLEELTISEENPTYLLYDNDKLIGALSIMVTEYYTKSHRCRVRIFYCESGELTHYQMLIAAMEPLPEAIHKLMMYVPDKKEDSIAIVKAMDFEYFQTSYVMERPTKTNVEVTFPEGYVLKPIDKEKDVDAYMTVRNEAFKTVRGSEIPITREMAIERFNEDYVLTDGIQLLWFNEKPIGLIHMIEEIDETGKHSFVAPIAIIPEHQGKGLGVDLLKAGLNIGLNDGYDNCMLCVIAENDKALALYKKVGFDISMSISAYNLALS